VRVEWGELFEKRNTTLGFRTTLEDGARSQDVLSQPVEVSAQEGDGTTWTPG